MASLLALLLLVELLLAGQAPCPQPTLPLAHMRQLLAPCFLCYHSNSSSSSSSSSRLSS
jgi:hypothetical protein